MYLQPLDLLITAVNMTQKLQDSIMSPATKCTNKSKTNVKKPPENQMITEV